MLIKTTTLLLGASILINGSFQIASNQVLSSPQNYGDTKLMKELQAKAQNATHSRNDDLDCNIELWNDTHEYFFDRSQNWESWRMFRAYSAYRANYISLRYVYKMPKNRKVSEIYKVDFIHQYETSMRAKTSWGSSSYEGEKINDKLQKHGKSLRFTNFATHLINEQPNWMTLLDIKKKSGLVVMRSKQEFAFRYFSYENVDYVILDIKMYAEIWGSSSGGGMWFPIGYGVALELDNSRNNTWS